MSKEARDARAQLLREERARLKKIPGLPTDTMATLHAVAAKEGVGKVSNDLTTQRIGRMMELADGENLNGLKRCLEKRLLNPEQRLLHILF